MYLYFIPLRNGKCIAIVRKDVNITFTEILNKYKQDNRFRIYDYPYRIDNIVEIHSTEDVDKAISNYNKIFPYIYYFEPELPLYSSKFDAPGNYIYILLLNNNKYYVGRTGNIRNRLDKHFNGDGSLWTKIHKPKSIINIFQSYDKYDENTMTLKMMDEYGIDNVRGASFCTRELTDGQINFIEDIIYSSDNRCYSCGSNNHFVSECEYK